MNYILTCPHCKVEDTYSTKDASDFQDTKGVLSREWECKKCGQSIEVTPFLASVRGKVFNDVDLGVSRLHVEEHIPDEKGVLALDDLWAAYVLDVGQLRDRDLCGGFWYRRANRRKEHWFRQRFL